MCNGSNGEEQQSELFIRCKLEGGGGESQMGAGSDHCMVQLLKGLIYVDRSLMSLALVSC